MADGQLFGGFVGDFTSFMITTYGAVYNGGAAYTANLRSIRTSSISADPCMHACIFGGVVGRGAFRVVV